jgi:hypothetical protein
MRSRRRAPWRRRRVRRGPTFRFAWFGPGYGDPNPGRENESGRNANARSDHGMNSVSSL